MFTNLWVNYMIDLEEKRIKMLYLTRIRLHYKTEKANGKVLQVETLSHRTERLLGHITHEQKHNIIQEELYRQLVDRIRRK